MQRNRLLVISIVFFAAYFAGAVMFRFERIFLDGAYYFFHVVQSENFWVEHQRFILIPSQLLTWMGVHLNLSLQTLLLLNSLNPAVYLLSVFLVCVVVLHDEAAGWMLMLMGVCGVYFLYFVPMYEVWYGAVLLVLFASMLRREFYESVWQLLLLGCTVLTLLFSYPLMVIGFICFSALHFLEIKRIPVRVAILFGVIVICWLAWKVLFISEYENGKVSYPYSRIGITLAENLGSAGNIRMLFVFLFSTYPEAMVMWLLTIIILLFRKQHAPAAVLLCFIAGYILLINATHAFPWKHSNYFERMYLLLIPLAVLPFLRVVFLSSPFRLLLELCIICILLYRGYRIVEHADRYANRINGVRSFVAKAQQYNGSKFFVHGEKYPGDAALDEWSFPMEALLFSSLKNPEHSVTISLLSDLEAGDVKPFLNENTFRLRLNEIRDDQWLNPQYFRLKHGLYREIPD